VYIGLVRVCVNVCGVVVGGLLLLRCKPCE